MNQARGHMNNTKTMCMVVNGTNADRTPLEYSGRVLKHSTEYISLWVIMTGCVSRV